MRRRTFLGSCGAGLLAGPGETASGIEPHFPTAAHQLVWRNWDLVPASRIAAALSVKPEQVFALAAAMSLGNQQLAAEYAPRLRFKALRRNWDFVPYEQIEALLGMGRADIQELLSRDSFYVGHLGPKPECAPIRVSGTASSRPIARFRDSAAPGGAEEPRFAFINRLSQPGAGPARTEPGAFSPRIAFPYFADYGDPLGAADFESYYPDGVLARMAAAGINAVWLHAVLRELVPSRIFTEFGKDSAVRLRRLNWLVDAARRHGMGVYIYLNEPRAMPDSFFVEHPELRGAPGRPGDGLHSMCTSTAPVQQFLTESSETLFRAAPGLAGVLLITASENPTNCYSLTRRTPCERCSRRSGAEVIGEVVSLIEKGIRATKRDANVVAWDWSWGLIEDDPQQKIIAALPRTVTLMVDFERGTPIVRDGVRSVVDEYSLSIPGPSGRASAHIKQARERGMRVMAKAQVGNTWELGLLPWIPVPHLVARKLSAMRRAGVSGAMESWTLGAWPSPNWLTAAAYYGRGEPEPREAVRNVALAVYGKEAAESALRAWGLFAQAFEQYPFSNSLVYSSVVQCGPAHPWWLKPSGKRARILNSYDDLRWTAPFGPERVAAMFESVARQWQAGLPSLEEATRRTGADRRGEAARDLNVARAAVLYFRSIANFLRFHSRRTEPAQVRAMVRDEIPLAEQFLEICRADSRVGFEASLQYFYLPLDIREKIVSCRHMLEVMGL